INQQYIINTIPEKDLWDRMKAWGFHDEYMQKLMPLCHTRIRNFGDFMDLCQFFFVNKIPLSQSLLCPKNLAPESIAIILQGMIWFMEEQENWGKAGIENASRECAGIFDVHHKNVIMKILYAALTGKHQGPPLFDSVEILGKDRTRA